MPNHITNIIEITDAGDVSLEDIRKVFLNDDNKIDFNVIYKMPECLENFQPHSGVLSAASAIISASISNNPLLANLETSSLEGFSKEDKALVRRAIANFNKCGYMYWYDWSNAGWGTKWNAYDQPEDGFPLDCTKFRFQTAWSHPYQLIELIALKLPTVEFFIQFADEDLGSNCGNYKIKNNVTYEEGIAPPYREQTEEQKKHYIKLAFNLCNPGVDPASYGYDDRWVFDEEIESNYYRKN